MDSLTPKPEPGWPTQPPPRSNARVAIALLIAVPLLAGIAGIALARRSSTSTSASDGPFVRDAKLSATDPRNLNSHWHAALGVYDCDHWMGDASGEGIWVWPAAVEAGFGGISPGRVGTKQYAGLHSHDDGVIHMEPATSDEAGEDATLGRYFEFGGWKLSSSGYDFLGTSVKNGDPCGEQPGKLQWAVAKFSSDLKNSQPYVVKSGNPTNYKLHNDDVIVLAFKPAGRSIEELGDPPSFANLPDAAAYEGGRTPPSSPTITTPIVTTPPLGSAKGKPCVVETGPSPKGAPTVGVVPGPPPTKLVIRDVNVGTGPVVKAGATVTVDYIGLSCSTGKVFDSSYSRGTPATFPLDGVIPGWQRGLQGMRVGGVRLLAIPPADAYGSQGAGPIGPDETLWFVVTVVKLG